MGNAHRNGNAVALVVRRAAPVIKFSVGETVKVIGDVGKLKSLQVGHGGFVDDMRSILGRAGTVAGIDEDGDLRVEFKERTWALNPAAVTPVCYVRVTGDVAELQRLQVGHGGFNEEMRDILGRVVEVTGIADGKDVRVQWNDSVWTVNPEAVTKASADEAEEEEDEENPAEELVKLFLAAALLQAMADRSGSS